MQPSFFPYGQVNKGNTLLLPVSFLSNLADVTSKFARFFQSASSGNRQSATKILYFLFLWKIRVVSLCSNKWFKLKWALITSIYQWCRVIAGYIVNIIPRLTILMWGPGNLPGWFNSVRWTPDACMLFWARASNLVKLLLPSEGLAGERRTYRFARAKR